LSVAFNVCGRTAAREAANPSALVSAGKYDVSKIAALPARVNPLLAV